MNGGETIASTMQKMEALVQQLSLLPHPEGGFYKETYRSAGSIESENLSHGFAGSRSFSTAIYYLLPAGNFSAFHAISSDECWHFYEGIPLNVYVIMPDSNLQIIRLGRDITNGELFQAVVPANCWFASRPVGDAGYSLTGCTVAPGFDFADFRLGNQAELITQFPQHQQLINELTR